MVIWECSYGADGDYYATKKEAQAAKVWSQGEAHLIRHQIKPGRKGLCEWLNANFGAVNGGQEFINRHRDRDA